MTERIRGASRKLETKREIKVSQIQKTAPSQSISSPIDQILFLQRTIGNQAVGRLIKSESLHKQSEIFIQASFGEVPAVPGWGTRVQEAKRNNKEIDLLNEIYITMYKDIKGRFKDLSIPVQPYQSGREIDGGVYFDRSLQNPGITDSVSRTTSGSCSGCGCTPSMTKTIVFIKLGPDALSEGTPKYSENILYHEYVHYMQRKSRMHGPLLESGTEHRRNVHKEALAHAESFRHYFGQLYWQGKSTMANRSPAEAISSLQLINIRYYESSDKSIQDEILQLITSVIKPPGREEKIAFLRELARNLYTSGWTGRSIFGEDLSKKINHLAGSE